MILVGNASLWLMFYWTIALGDAVSVNVTMSTKDVKNGSALTLVAAYDPTLGKRTFGNLECESSNPAGRETKRLTEYSSFNNEIIKERSQSPFDYARLNITSPCNPMMLVISPITFSDEKRLFYCILKYFDAVGNPLFIISEKHRLENVYIFHPPWDVSICEENEPESTAFVSVPWKDTSLEHGTSFQEKRINELLQGPEYNDFFSKCEISLNEADSIKPLTSITQDIAANLTCIASGRPAPIIRWQHNSTIIAKIYNTSVGSLLITVTSVLTILNPTHKIESEQITCLVSHPFTSARNNTTILTIKYAPVQVQLKTSSAMPINGSSVTLTCKAMSRVSPSFRFLFINGSSKLIVQDGNSTNYTTLPLNYKDYNNYKATFQCISYNRAGESPPKTLVLDIQVTPQISTSSTIAAIEGQDVVLHCNIIAANPAAKIIWSSPISSIIPSTNGRALLPLVNRRQHGEYTCFASNGIGSVTSKTAYLSVNYGPEFIHNSTEKLGCIGERTFITCNAVGQPMPHVFLYRNGTLLKKSLSNLTYQFQLDSESRLGTYICVSNNTLGTVAITRALKIKPSGGVKNVIMHVKDNIIKVTWQLPECSGNIREIKVQYRKKGQSNWQWELKTATIADTDITINGLEKGEEYEVRVVVVDANGVTHKKIGQNATTAEIQSTDNGALIGGIVGGLCLLIIVVIAFILVARKHRLSSGADNRSGRNTYSGIDDEMMDSDNIEMRKHEDLDFTIPVGPAYENVQDKQNALSCLHNKGFIAESDGSYTPLDNEQINMKDQRSTANSGALGSHSNNDQPEESDAAMH